jgi:dTDP-4-amino-4,6-dideoxygalactose transaminase
MPIAKPLLGEGEAEATRRVILSGWVTQGPEVAAFEREFAACVGAVHAVAVSNCTTALHLALLAVGVGQGDEVITVSHSFIATANAVRYCGAEAIFVDIERDSFNIDPGLIEPAITDRTKAILCVHQLGMPCDLGRILEIGRRRGIPVIEDAACAIGSEIFWNGGWEKIGKPHGDIACFSFHPRKVVTTGDGGMVTTTNPEYDRKLRLWRQHSMSVADIVRHGTREVIFETYPELGFNYRMTDLQAAIGREQLKRLPALIQGRRQLAELYASILRNVPGLQVPIEPSWARSNWQSYCVRLPRGCEQRTVMQHMLDRGFATRRGVMCSHVEGAYKGRPGFRGASSLHLSEEAHTTGVMLPLFGEMSGTDVRHVCEALAEVVASSETAPVAEYFDGTPRLRS